jgi:hypothetical protein
MVGLAMRADHRVGEAIQNSEPAASFSPTP